MKDLQLYSALKQAMKVHGPQELLKIMDLLGTQQLVKNLKLTINSEELRMHTEFAMKIEFHVKKWDDRKVFIRAIRDAMQLLYTQAAMMSEDAPTMTFTVEDGKHGTRVLKIFNEA